jgi:transposase
MCKAPKTKRKQERLTEHEKQLIIKSYAMEVPLSTLSRQIGKSRTSISTFYSRWKLDSTLPPKEKRSRTLIQGSMALAIKKQVLDTPKLGLRKLTQKLKERLPGRDWYYMLNIRYPRKTAIHKFLQMNSFKKRNPTLKAPLSAANRKKRLDFANRWLENGKCTLENVIWTDESRFASHPNNRKVQVWTNTGEVPIQTKMHSGGNSVMFWGCFSKHGPGPLVSLQGTMDGKEYVKVLKENLLPELKEAKRLYGGTWRVMQDNAPCHTAKLTNSFIKRNKLEFIDWPPYSPDLNPIENIWHWMKHVLETEFPVCESAEQIEGRVFKIWTKINVEMCAKYCSNYEKRLLAVVKANGGYTKY